MKKIYLPRSFMDLLSESARNEVYMKGYYLKHRKPVLDEKGEQYQWESPIEYLTDDAYEKFTAQVNGIFNMVRELDCLEYEIKDLRELRTSVNHIRKLLK